MWCFRAKKIRALAIALSSDAQDYETIFASLLRRMLSLEHNPSRKLRILEYDIVILITISLDTML